MGSKHSGKNNIILICIDSLRPDHLSCLGYDKNTTPNIDLFSKDAVVFKQAISQSSWTKTSVASLFTGLYPSQHQVLTGSLDEKQAEVISDVLDNKFVSLAEIMHQNKYDTWGFIDNEHLQTYYGFNRGFQTYVTKGEYAKFVNRSFLKCLRYHKYNKFFACLYYMDVHYPYMPLRKYVGRFRGLVRRARLSSTNNPEQIRQLRAKVNDGIVKLSEDDIRMTIYFYDRALYCLDTYIGLLLKKIQKMGLYKNSMIIITSDHGEEFMEHGKISHGWGHSLYDELIRVPLIIKFPGEKYKDSVDKQVQIIDILPTILRYLNIKSEIELPGYNLMRFLKNKDDFEYPAYSETQSLKSVRFNNHKFILNKENQEAELYNLETDPKELNNLANKGYTIEKELRTLLDKQTHYTIKNNTKKFRVEKETIEKLKALGYLN